MDGLAQASRASLEKLAPVKLSKPEVFLPEVSWLNLGSWTRVLGEAKPGGFQTRVFPTFFGKGPDCVADPFGTVPRRCS